MTAHTQIPSLQEFETVTATDIKKDGWKRVVARLKNSTGKAMTVTNHREPEVVLMTVDQYQALVAMAAAGGSYDEGVLDALRQDFDKRLNLLRSADVAERAHQIMDEPIRTKGRYRVEDSY